jgi:hypothetical protein
MSVEISSTFQITVDVAINAGTAVVIQNPGRTMRVVSVAATAADGAVVSVGRLRGGVSTTFATATVNSPNLVNAPITVTNIAAANLLATDDIDIGSATANTLQVILYCTGSPAQSLDFA